MSQFRSSRRVSELAVAPVPEPYAHALMLDGGCIGFVARRCRRVEASSGGGPMPGYE